MPWLRAAARLSHTGTGERMNAASRLRYSLAMPLALAAFAMTDPGAQERSASASPGEAQQFLRAAGGLTPSQLQAVERGEPLAKVLDTDKRQIAILGAVRIRAPRERLLDRYRNVTNLKSSPIILQVGPFGTPARVEDMQGLTFEDYDLRSLRTCKPGDCNVRLPAEAVTAFSREIDWRAPDATARSNALWRRLLVEYTERYRTGGALAEYHNKEEPLSVAGEFGVLFDDSRQFTSLAPEFLAYLRQYPRTRLAGAEDVLYWAKEDIGIRPVTSITHLTIYAPPAEPGRVRRPAFVGTKEIWATHYFDAGLGLALAFDDGASGFFMVCINRIRTRSLTGIMRAPVRSAVQRRSRDAMESILRATKTALEQSK
jgi:hypothetical protein